jgi:hypothetical protein
MCRKGSKRFARVSRSLSLVHRKDVNLAKPLQRAIDKGLANSRVGVVLITSALMRWLLAQGIADK